MPCKNSRHASGVMAVDRWITGLMGAAIVVGMLYHAMWHLLLVIVGLFLFWECFNAFPKGRLRWISLIYVTTALVCLWDAPWVLLPLAWLNDTGAYIMGTLVGGPRLCPRISPAKTWSGLVGGVIMGACGMWILSTWQWPIAMPHWSFLFWVFLSIIGHGGDLAESWMKRQAGIKDTGAYLPGHGGFLDRCDSILAMGLAYALWTIFCPV